MLGFWRHVLRQWPPRYQAALWTVVFPIGMYGVASRSLGDGVGLSFMGRLSRGALWTAAGAWLLVVAAGLAQVARRPASTRHAGSRPTQT